MIKVIPKMTITLFITIMFLYIGCIPASAASTDIKLKTCVVAPNYITLNWNAISGASQYQITYKKSSESKYKNLYSSTNKIQIKKLNANTCYNFKIRAKVGSKYGSYKSFNIYTYIAKSSSFKIWYNATKTTVELRCKEVKDIQLNSYSEEADGYQVYKINGTKKELVKSFKDTTYSLSSISKPHVSQKYAVRFYVNKKIDGVSVNYFSKFYEMNVIPAPKKVSGLKAIKSGNNIILTWSIPQNGADGYRVYAATTKNDGSTTNWELYYTISDGNKTTCMISKKPNINNYVFKVASYSKNPTRTSKTEISNCQNIDEAEYSNTANASFSNIPFFRVQTSKNNYSFKGYAGLIIVGDSRTAYMKETPNITKKYPKTIFIAKAGSKYDWMENTAFPELEQYLNSKQKYIVVFNHGVNDLEDLELYKSFYSSKITNNPNYNKHKYYFMSVNPIFKNCRTDRMFFMPNHKIQYIQNFNKSMQSFWGKRNYIDCYSYLINTGYDSYDGIHYEDNTNIKIMNYILNFITKNN